MTWGTDCTVCGRQTCSWVNGKRCEGKLHPDRVARRDARARAASELLSFMGHVAAWLAICFVFGVILYASIVGAPGPY